MVKEYSDTQLEGIRQLFRSLPTFEDGPDGGTIKPPDLPNVIEKIGFNRSFEERNTAAEYLINRKVNPGLVTWEEFMGACKVAHDPAAFAKYEAQLADTNGDGFISKDEFEVMLPFLVAYEPLLKEVHFDKFVEEADTNKDGKISIDEYADWIASNLKGRVTST